MFVRFVAPLQNEHRHLTGVFQVGFDLRSAGRLADYEEAWLDDAMDWFNRRLPVPLRLSRSRRPGAYEKALCWFKEDAKEHIGKARELTALLEQHGVPTRMIRTTRPGYVVYEDRYQVAAVPFVEQR